MQNYIDSNDIKTYIEPFVGGANIIDKIKCDKKIGYDNNEYLISMWNALQKGYEPPGDITKEEYKYVKDHKDEFSKEYIGISWAMVVILLSCFAPTVLVGLYSITYSGYFFCKSSISSFIALTFSTS